MGDDTLRAIDRLFDFVDNGADIADRVLNRHKYTEEQHRARVKTRREVIDADPSPSAPKKPSGKASTSTAVATTKKPRFYIMESVVDGHTIYVVTDGGAARTECGTRAFAQEILKALEKAS